MTTEAQKIIFLGNGMLADYALAVLRRECQVIFHARTAKDLEKVCELKRLHPEAHGVLASFGVIIKKPVLELFEPEGILNIHPSLLPLYRGPSPIESAILAGDIDFGVSVMKLVPEMDAGPIYTQATLSGLPLDKETIYRELATAGGRMALGVIDARNLESQMLPDKEDEKQRKKWLERVKQPIPQDDSKATYTEKLTKSMGILTPETDKADLVLRKIVAFQGFPKPKYTFFGVSCIILEAHVLEKGETAVLPLPCADGAVLAIDRLQPEGRKAMDAKSFVNGYARLA